MLIAADELFVVIVEFVVVIDDANDALLVLTVLVRVSTFAAIEDEKVVFTDPTLVILEASDELLLFTVAVRLLIAVAADELFVATVP